jgi:hypothetical protein
VLIHGEHGEWYRNGAWNLLLASVTTILSILPWSLRKNVCEVAKQLSFDGSNSLSSTSASKPDPTVAHWRNGPTTPPRTLALLFSLGLVMHLPRLSHFEIALWYVPPCFACNYAPLDSPSGCPDLPEPLDDLWVSSSLLKSSIVFH